MKYLTLDAGALIAFDRGSHRLLALVRAALAQGATLVIPTCVLAQAWRDGSRQARLARLLKSEIVVFEDLTPVRARAVGELCARRETSDIADTCVAIVAERHGGFVVTTDAADLSRLAPGLVIVPAD